MPIPKWDNRVFLSVWVAKPRPVFSTPEQYQALLDTGATHSMITSDIVNQLSLPAIDRIVYSSASENEKETTRHLIRLNLDQASAGKDEFIIGVAKMAINPYYFQVLLGMDVLSFYEIKISRGKLFLKRLLST